jgi:hypothetical protein
MGRRPIRKKAMTSAQRSKLYREGLKPNSTRSKQRRRIAREQALAAATLQAWQQLGAMVFAVLYVDFAWRIEPYSRVTGLNRAADILVDGCGLAQLAHRGTRHGPSMRRTKRLAQAPFSRARVIATSTGLSPLRAGRG